MSIQALHEWLSIVLKLTLGLSVLLAGWNYHRFSKHFKIFTIYLVVTFIFEVTGMFLYWRQLGNLWLIHLYTLAEFILLALFYQPLLKTPKLLLNSYYPLLILIGGIIIANSLLIQPFDQFNSYSETFENICVIGLAVILFFNILQFDLPVYQSKALKWINSGILLYLSGSLFIFLFSQYLLDTSSVELQRAIFLLNIILNLIFKVILLVSVIRMIRETDTNEPSTKEVVNLT